MQVPGELPHDRQALGLPGALRLGPDSRERQRVGDGDAGGAAGLQAVQERPEQPLVVVEAVAPGPAFGQVVAGRRAQAGAHRAAPGQGRVMDRSAAMSDLA